MKRIDKYIRLNIDSLDNKTVIITGANSGIGFSAANIFAGKNAHVVLAGRSSERLNNARIRILKKFPNANIDVELYNQGSVNSIKDFTKNIQNKYPDFHALVLNAGVYHPKKGLITNENYPLTSGVNFFGNLLIVELLQDFLLKKENETRIIFQSSIVARSIKKSKKFNFEKAFIEGKLSRGKQYSYSKYGVTNIFNFYKNHNTNPNIKYLCSEPGVAKTNILRSFPKLFRFIANPFMSIVFHSSEKASLPICYLSANKVANGDYMIPNRLSGIKGYPKYFSSKEKYLSEEIILMALLEISNG